jgi:uncharacterized membrane protein YqjE
MSRNESAADDEADRGFFNPLRAALAALTAVFHTRLELFVTELEEERERLKQALLLTLLVFFGFSLGLILLTIFVVALFWERGWVYAVGGLSAFYLAMGTVAGILLRQNFLLRQGMFRSSLDELAKDRDWLRNGSHE